MDVYLGTFPTPKDPSATLEGRGKTLGEAGIRTLGTLLGYNALAKRRFRPLSHLTKHESGEYSAGGRTSN
jgi:hypothetical protein